MAHLQELQNSQVEFGHTRCICEQLAAEHVFAQTQRTDPLIKNVTETAVGRSKDKNI